MTWPEDEDTRKLVEVIIVLLSAFVAASFVAYIPELDRLAAHG